MRARVMPGLGVAAYRCCIEPESKTLRPLADGTAESSALATAAASMGL